MKDDLSPVLKNAVRKAVKSMSVSSLLNKKFFDNSMPLPHRIDFFKGKPCCECGKRGDVDQVVAQDAYRKACNARRAHENLQNKRFKFACFYELGLEDLFNKAPGIAAWDIAWADGHSAGLYEVFSKFETLSRILNVI